VPDDSMETTDASLGGIPCLPLGAQPPFVASDLEAFVHERRVGILAYVRADGRPNQTPIWHTYREGSFYMTTLTGSPKHCALLREPRISLTIQDERPPYRALIVSGVATLAPLDADTDPTDGVTVRYFGKAAATAYEGLMSPLWEARGLTLVTLAPTELRGFDNTRGLSKVQRAFIRLREALPIPRAWL